MSQMSHTGSTSGTSGLDAYAESMEASGTPLLGHLVLYSIFDGQVTRGDLELWFLQLGLDSAFLPPEIRPVDAYEKVTGPSGVRATYSLDPGAVPGAPGRRRRRPTNGTAREATLMLRPVRRDGGQIVRHLVREVRDETKTRLSYDPRLGEAVFRRDTRPEAGPGAGDLQVTPDHAAISTLPENERVKVYSLLDELSQAYARRCLFMTGDRLRALVRGIIEALNAIRVRPTGGVYFVHRAHAEELAKLRDLVARMGAGSHLSRIPIPDQDEMREMIISAYVTKAKDDLDKLAADIAAAQAAGASEAEVAKLYKRFQAVQSATTEHSELLSTSLDDTDAALQLVKVQLGGLLATAGTNDAAEQAEQEEAMPNP